jgi:two-component system, chemotaxis family, chemotaxis protein CheY
MSMMDSTPIKKILLVDDSPVSRRILKSCIARAEQYEFYEADDGVGALEIFKRTRPDVTFMDISMPNMNGVECLAEIRKVDGKAIVIMCSSEINPGSLKIAISLGALTAVKKPPTKETIQEALAKAREAIG